MIPVVLTTPVNTLDGRLPREKLREDNGVGVLAILDLQQEAEWRTTSPPDIVNLKRRLVRKQRGGFPSPNGAYNLPPQAKVNCSDTFCQLPILSGFS